MNIVSLHEVHKAYAEKVPLDGVSFGLDDRDRAGVIGLNGSGKSTLLKLVAKLEQPDSGRVVHRNGLCVRYLEQQPELHPHLTPLQAAGGTRQAEVYLDKLGLGGVDQPLATLSGGQRRRIALAEVLADDPDLLVLDEPTNDLDMETLDLLQEIVANYAGTVLLVSHDRDFLDRTVTATIAPAADGRARWLAYAGGYADMIAQRRAEVADDRGRGGATAAGPAVKAERTSQRPPARAAKLSFKHAHALDTLPGEMEATTAEIAALEGRMGDPDLFAKQPDRFAALAKELDTKRAALEAMEERWMEAEMAREELEGA